MPFPTEPSHHLAYSQCKPWDGSCLEQKTVLRLVVAWGPHMGSAWLPLRLLPFLIFRVYLYLQVYEQQFCMTSVQVCILSPVKRTLCQTSSLQLWDYFFLSCPYNILINRHSLRSRSLNFCQEGIVKPGLVPCWSPVSLLETKFKWD